MNGTTNWIIMTRKAVMIWRLVDKTRCGLLAELRDDPSFRLSGLFRARSYSSGVCCLLLVPFRYSFAQEFVQFNLDSRVKNEKGTEIANCPLSFSNSHSETISILLFFTAHSKTKMCQYQQTWLWLWAFESREQRIEGTDYQCRMRNDLCCLLFVLTLRFAVMGFACPEPRAATLNSST